MAKDLAGLDGMTALVIGGGGGGIGRSVSMELARGGAKVAVVDLDLARAQAVQKEIEAEGLKAIAMQANALKADEATALIDKAWNELSGIDVLAMIVGGNRGLAPWQVADKNTDKQWADVMDMNLNYVFYAVRAVLPKMVERERGGSIVGIGSLSGVAGSPRHFAYGIAKAGVIHMAKSIAIEYGQHGIRMNTVSPGRILTPATSDTITDAQLKTFSERIPLGRIGESQDIASAVRFFASPASSYISGQNLMVDGGVTARFPVPLPGTAPYETF